MRWRAAHSGSLAALAMLGACVEELRFFPDAGRTTQHAPSIGDAAAARADAASTSQPEAGPEGTAACGVDLSAWLPLSAASTVCDRSTSVLFRYALCSCADIKLALPLTTDAFDSRVAPYAPGARGGSVGTNGRLTSASALDIGGSIIASGAGPAVVFAGASSRISDYMRLNAELSLNTAELKVERDLWVNGRILSVNGTLHVGRQISQPNAGDNLGEIAAAQGLHAEPVKIDPACACGDDSRVDFDRLAEYFSAHSDNAAQDLQPDALISPKLTWPCGRFMVTGGSTAATHWKVIDHADVFVDGDLELTAPLEVELDAQAELDVFVHGSLRFGEAAELSTTRPGALRFYVSGADPIQLPLGARFDGSLYAPNAQLRVRDQSAINGAFLVSELVASTALAIHYDAAASPAAVGCSTSCTMDSDCSPPWICEDGQCVATH